MLEVAANAAMAASVVLAGRNSIHTWWLGIIGCSLFGVLFLRTQLYADATLQVFLIATSAVGWWQWRHRERAPRRAIGHGKPVDMLAAAAAGVLAAVAYGAFLDARTDAHAPFADSLVLMLSVIAQLLLMRRRVETWWFWIAVNIVAIPLFASRGLWLTSALYTGYLVNAVVALHHWKKLEARHGGHA